MKNAGLFWSGGTGCVGASCTFQGTLKHFGHMLFRAIAREPLQLNSDHIGLIVTMGLCAWPSHGSPCCVLSAPRVQPLRAAFRKHLLMFGRKIQGMPMSGTLLQPAHVNFTLVCLTLVSICVKSRELRFLRVKLREMCEHKAIVL